MTRSAMVVLNDIVRDNRVLKMARVMKKMSSEFVLIGMKSYSNSFKAPTRMVIDGIPCLLFPRPRVMGGTDYSRNAEQSNFRLWELSTEILNANIVEHLSDLDIDHVHTHDMYALQIGHDLRELQRRKGKEIVWIHDVHEYARGSTHMPELHHAFALAQEQRYLPLADHVITVTQALKRRLEAAYEFRNPVTVIHNSPGFPVTPSARSIRADVGTTDALAVYAGNVKPGRGVERFFKCLVTYEGLHYAIVTNNAGAHINELKQMAADLGISDRVHWLPYVPPTQVSSYLSDADFGVLPFESYGNTEVSLPNKLFDYVFGNLPILSSDLEALSEFVSDYPVGLVCDFDDQQALSDAVLRLKEMDIAQARDRVVSDFRWERQVRELAQLYQDRIDPGTRLLLQGDRVRPEGPEIKVLHGITASAGQPAILSAALKRMPGIAAECLQYAQPKFGYRKDLFFPVDNTQPREMGEVFKSLAEGFDIFHFHGRPFFYNPTEAELPVGYDLLLLKAMGKRVFVHFRGSEVRLRSRFMALNPHAYDSEADAGTGSRFSEEAQIEYIRRVSAIADGVFVVDPELQSYVPEAQIVERAIDLEEWPCIGVHDRERPLIVHAPSRRGTKGTEEILAVIEALRAEGLEFDFELVEGLTNQQARKVYERADIVLDQMRIGWYGVLSVEAMALGKAVLCYIRPDLVHHLGAEPPLAVSDLDRLKADLTRLIADKALRIDLGRRARAYCEAVHADTVVAAKLEGIYREALSRPQPQSLSQEDVIDFMVADAAELQRLRKALKKAAAGAKPAVSPTQNRKAEERIQAALARSRALLESRTQDFAAREARFRARIETLNTAVATLKDRVNNLKAAVDREKEKAGKKASDKT